MTASSSLQFDWDAPSVAALVRATLDEDIGRGDLTTLATVPPNVLARARIIAKLHKLAILSPGQPLVK